MAKKSPLQLVKDQFGDKAKLVLAIKTFTTEDLWLGRTNADKGLDLVSNAKLLRLHAIFTEVKTTFGTRGKLIDALLGEENRTKDAGYRAHFERFPVPRLLDLYKSLVKRHKDAARKAALPTGATTSKSATAPAKVAKPPSKKGAPAKKSATKK